MPFSCSSSCVGSGFDATAFVGKVRLESDLGSDESLEVWTGSNKILGTEVSISDMKLLSLERSWMLEPL